MCGIEKIFPFLYRKYSLLLAKSRQRAQLTAATPHLLQHGGASADGMLRQSSSKPLLSDLCQMKREDWTTIAKRQYRKPAKYLRQIRQLSSSQITTATEAPRAIMALLTVL